jgi:dTDP-4-dehydrorhamnose reductase
MKITIFGGTGLLGKELVRACQGREVQALGSKDVDIRDASAVDRIVAENHPDWIVLAAAYTDVDGCESHRDLAFAVNRDGAANVAKAAKNAGSQLLFVSTDYVFDGTKSSPYEVDDIRNPRSVYGSSKAEAELRLLEILPDCCIARTSWLFGTGGKSFPDTILKLAAARPTLDVVNDQRGCPTYAVDLAQAIVQLCERQASGIVHATNRGACTWYEFARAIVSGGKLTTDVRPTTTDKFPRPAERPKYSVLSPRSLDSYRVVMPEWPDALRRYLLERSAS